MIDMKKLLSSLLLLPLLAQAAPQFKDYPADVYQGARHKVVLNGIATLIATLK